MNEMLAQGGIENQWLLLNLLFARGSQWLLWKSMVDKQSFVAMEVKGCYVKSKVAIEVTDWYGKSMTDMEVTGCNESPWLLWDSLVP
jgi:hypothetical protein